MGRMFVRTPAMDATVPKDEVWLRSDVPVKPDENLEKLAETMIKKNPRNACIGCRFFTQGRYGRGKCGVNRDMRTIDDTCSSFKPRLRVGVILVNPYLPTPPVAGPRRPTGYNPGRIRIGDVVTVTHPGDRPGTRYTRRIRVEGGDEKDGKPVIDGVIVSSTDPHDEIGGNAWAYEYQIVGRNPHGNVGEYVVGHRKYRLRKYGPGKFEGGYIIDQYVYEIMDEIGGDVTTIGVFASTAELGPRAWTDVDQVAREAGDSLTDDERSFLQDMEGAIAIENDQGFVSVEYFSSRPEYDKKVEEVDMQITESMEREEGEGDPY